MTVGDTAHPWRTTDLAGQGKGESWEAGRIGCGERYLAAPFLVEREHTPAGAGMAEEVKGHSGGRGLS